MKKLIAVLLLLMISSVSYAVDSDVVVRDDVAKRTKMQLRAGEDSGTSTVISSAEITVYESFVIADTEANAASDTLSTINAGAAVGQYDGVQDGDYLLLRQELASQDITIDETGNVDLVKYSSITLGSINDYALFFYDESQSKWVLHLFIDDDGDLGAVSLGGKLTAGSNEIEGSNFDVNGGAIDGTPIGANSASTGVFTTSTTTTLSITTSTQVPTGAVTGAGANTANATWAVTDGINTFYIPLYTSQ